MKKVIFLSFIMFSTFYANETSNILYNFSQEKIESVKNKYGKKAVKRFLILDSVLEKSKNKDILTKLKNINDFWNRVTYKSDLIHWNKKDYWATPFEFLGTGAGDSEDYVIAKYFSLRKLGIPKSKLKISYIKFKEKTNKPHMVLSYYHKPNSIPIVLDNIDKKLKLASKRIDFIPTALANNTAFTNNTMLTNNKEKIKSLKILKSKTKQLSK
ncbi:MAG: transglutaminase-like cysteine peptidase [Halarcobacter sp.]